MKYEIHYLRGIAILLIISSHILSADVSGFFYRLLRLFFENSTLLFAFISGYLFQYLTSKYHYRNYLIKKFNYVILPYLVISIPLITFRVLQEHSFLALSTAEFIEGRSLVYQILFYITTGLHLVPYWYIPLISVFFLLAPVFYYVDKRPKMYWILPVLLVLAQLLPRDEFQDITKFWTMFGHFAFIYVFGMFASHYQDKLDSLNKKYYYVVVALFVCTSLLSIFYDAFRAQIVYFQKVMLIFVLLETLIKFKSKRVEGFLSKMADTSFGMYFVHYVIILLLRNISLRLFGNELPLSVAEWIITYLIVLGLSYYMVRLMQVIFKKNSRFLIGS